MNLLAPPIIDASQSDNVTRVTIGRPVTLRCFARGHPSPNIVWKKDNLLVKESDMIRISNGGQMLEIKESQTVHAGSWVCSAENDAGTNEFEILLDVWVPPTVQVRFDADAKVLGESVQLVCEVSGNPPPSIEWSRGDQPIMNNTDDVYITNKGAYLTIAHLETHNAGNYTCIATNGAGNAESTVLVDILVPPSIDRDEVDMSLRLPAGQTATLYCNVSGNPEPAVKWYLNDSEILPSTYGIELGSTFIKISNITLQDEGMYKCVAFNAAGNDTLLYTVGVVRAPIIPYGGAQSVVEGKMTSIECAAEGHPVPVVSWLRNGLRVESGIQGFRYVTEDNVLTITEAQSSDSGIYVCEATNEAGTARQAYTLEVLVSPKIILSSPVKSPVPFGSSFSLKCGVRGYPQPIVSWYLNDVPLSEKDGGVTIGSDGTLTVDTNFGDAPRTYKCTARNDAGQDEVSYEIHVMG
ncbi:Immunoglobulin I-set domain protein [Trichostrongylus colubriformis]|uniref:Immunoglobulin I-set domain protein n=1 Tax=Trichostrongylus colubriformis TaxID=6319 RepID=A0AAN8FXU5_TRICO